MRSWRKRCNILNKSTAKSLDYQRFINSVDTLLAPIQIQTNKISEVHDKLNPVYQNYKEQMKKFDEIHNKLDPVFLNYKDQIQKYEEIRNKLADLLSKFGKF